MGHIKVHTVLQSPNLNLKQAVDRQPGVRASTRRAGDSSRILFEMNFEQNPNFDLCYDLC